MRQTLTRWLAIIVALLSVAGCVGNAVDIPPQTIPEAHAPSRPIPGFFSLPKGTGPFPAVVILHGCDGVQPEERDWAWRLNDWGYASLIVDSFSPRGIAQCGANGEFPKNASYRDRAGDALSAALWLRGQPGIDPNRIGLVGTSYGGGVAALVTQDRYDRLYPGLLKVVVMYSGHCWNPQSQGSVPLLDLTGEADDWSDFDVVKSCRAFAEALPPGKVFEMHAYPGAHRDFENIHIPRNQYKGHLVGYDFAGAHDSFIRTKAFLDRYLMASGA